MRLVLVIGFVCLDENFFVVFYRCFVEERNCREIIISCCDFFYGIKNSILILRCLYLDGFRSFFI